MYMSYLFRYTFCMSIETFSKHTLYKFICITTQYFYTTFNQFIIILNDIRDRDQ